MIWELALNAALGMKRIIVVLSSLIHGLMTVVVGWYVIVEYSRATIAVWGPLSRVFCQLTRPLNVKIYDSLFRFLICDTQCSVAISDNQHLCSWSLYTTSTKNWTNAGLMLAQHWFNVFCWIYLWLTLFWEKLSVDQTDWASCSWQGRHQTCSLPQPAPGSGAECR